MLQQKRHGLRFSMLVAFAIALYYTLYSAHKLLAHENDPESLRLESTEDEKQCILTSGFEFQPLPRGKPWIYGTSRSPH